MRRRAARLQALVAAAGAREALAAVGAAAAAARRLRSVGEALQRALSVLAATPAEQARLAAAVKSGRDQMLADAAQRADAQDFAKTNAVIFGFHDAWAANCPKKQYDERVENLMEDAREHLRDVDEFRGYLDRPVGETVARLCEALDLDPGACEKDGDIWIVRRPLTEFETSLPLYKYPRSPVPPSPPGEGGSARSAETGGGWQPQSPDIYDAARAPP
jgi:hypothetical protein